MSEHFLIVCAHSKLSAQQPIQKHRHCLHANQDGEYFSGRRYGVKSWDYPQISLAPLILVVILDPEKGSKHFFEKYSFLVVCPPKPNFGPKLESISYLINYKVINS